ncbi:VHS domain-containing protein [Xylona heveae TC161]|uniref:VHS domain-containing protein n=1 Tax=Xylona heveae (strain CBS 132557 / TC161) TaxID=1328760 RepID=A0A165ICC6_XYLHT|nr:VHS domain-containing protein [Xylona heveae TC161]KZF24700.1 VHS domain-containing protein [Xylona heveae TC161]
MAARDRLGGLGDPSPSVLQRFIQNACDPQNYEPNLALDLEIADLINSKKGNAPREAAVAIVHFINHRNPNVSLLALTLLDICVKNCGYPFHLQISTKEFLNELVRRFPERPPMRPTKVQLRILEAIEEWRQTICQTSRYKEDLGFIRDMHRLLSYKGYMFPEVRKEDAAVLNPSDNLRSAEEMEEEERAAQSAKLQELIRRGTPADLQEANKLMKVMAGYDTRNKTDYRAKAAEEVGKIQEKARLLEDMLQQYREGDAIREGDVFEELSTALSSAQPKIQKMCEEESDDTEAVAKLLEINDSIHRTIERYKLIKKGDLSGASKIPKGTLGTTTGVSKNAENELSLIDLGGPEPAPAPAPAPAPVPFASTSGSSAPVSTDAPKAGGLEDDLLGLSFQDSSYGQGGGISLGLGGAPSSTLPTFASPQQTPLQALTPTLSPPPPPPPQATKPNYDAFAALSSLGSSSQTATPPPALSQQPPAPQPRAAADPFASLTSSSQRQDSPFQFQQHTSATPSGFGFGQPAAPAPVQPTSAAADDEWTFSSALPDQPETKEVLVLNSGLQVVLAVSRPAGQNPTLEILARFSNNSAQALSDLTFQVAVTRGYSLKLEPQSGRSMQPHQRNGITQSIHLNGVERGKGNTVKLRWKASYREGIEFREEQGEIPSLGVA